MSYIISFCFLSEFQAAESFFMLLSVDLLVIVSYSFQVEDHSQFIS